MYANTMLLPATSRRRTPMCWAIAKPTAVVAGTRGITMPTAAPHAAVRTQVPTTPFTDQVAAAAANGVTAGLRTRRRPPA